MAGGKPVEVASVENEELAVVDGSDVGAAALAAEQGHFAEKGTGLQANGAASASTSTAPDE